MNDVNIAVAVVTGKHTFDIPGFQQMFNSMSNMEFYLQDLETVSYTHLTLPTKRIV